MTTAQSSARWAASAILLLIATAGCATQHSFTPPPDGHHDIPNAGRSVGFLVLAPDRGFLGNEEIRDAFAELAMQHNAALVFVGDERTRGPLQQALAKLALHGAGQVVALPLFITASHPRWQLVSRLLDEFAPPALAISKRFGSTYLAVELLADHFRQIPESAGRRVVVVGYGANDSQTRQGMLDELTVLATAAGVGFAFESLRVVVWHELTDTLEEALTQQSSAALQDAIAGGTRTVVIPFHLGMKLDGMMSFNGFLRRSLAETAELLQTDITSHPEVALWMQREANRYTLSAQSTGVIVLAHGADFFWNETMREALQPVVDRYPTEFAFSMADQTVVERAVRRLEKCGVRGIVIVRVFGMASSFRQTIERMTGIDIEQGSEQHQRGRSMRATAPRPRIRSTAVITTVGGLEDHPLFAQALTARAQELSQDPARETVILLAHGLGDDARNDHWLSVLESLAGQMRANGGSDFRAIHVATWREDWPDKRDPWLAKIRGQVQKASENGGIALVIPARTSAQGNEREWLDGLSFKLGEGFAPHILFARWVEDQIRQGQQQLLAQSGQDAGPDKVPE